MNVSVFGLGYVGSVSAACFAADGHTVVGVDVNADKVASISEGRSPIVEKGLGDLIAQGAATARLRATRDTGEAVNATDLSLICVGTPSRRNGSLDLTYLERVCEEIGDALRQKDDYHVVVVRSTVLPGTTHSVVIPALERSSGKHNGTGFGVAVNPEFLREGTAIHDFRHPPMTLVGHNQASDGSRTEALYAKVEAPLVTTAIRTAEMIKYASNTWHALKVCFANEVGNLCKRLEIDSHEVMDIFCRDEKLNLSSYYMKPGFAFGGSCLPKDVARNAVSRQGGRPGDAGRPGNPGEQQSPDSACARPDHRNRPQARRPSRFQLQGGHRRPAREPAGHPRRGSARQGPSASYLRSERLASHGWSARIASTSRSKSLISRRCCAIRYRRSSTHPTYSSSGTRRPSSQRRCAGRGRIRRSSISCA